MTAIFPDPLPEELLYSAIARYAARMRYPEMRAVLRAVFGRDTHTAVLDLPTGLDRLVERLPPGHAYTAERLLYGHTTYPYYRWFISAERAERAEQALCASSKETVGSILGTRASTVPSPRQLQYCPSCFSAELEMHGFAVWHRTHQMPGVLVCPIHGIALKESAHARASRVSRQAFHPLDERAHSGERLAAPERPAHEVLVHIAEDTLWLLRNHAETEADLLPRYLALAAAHGFARDSGYVWISRLRSAITDFYGEEFLEAVGCAVATRGDDWLARLVRSSRGGAHPLQHILLCRLLGVSVQDLLTLDAATLRQLSAKMAPASGPEPETRPGRPRGAKLGVPDPEWEERLRSYVADGSLTLTKIAATLGTERLTVQRHAKRLGVWRPEWRMNKGQGTPKSEVKARNRKECRGKWKALRAAHPPLSRSQLGALAPDVYQWLLRNDAEWLDQHSLPRRQSRGGSTRVDWRARDAALSVRIEAVAADIRAAPGKPVRITRKELSRRLGEDERVLSNPIQLPRTATAAEHILESQEAWHERRLRWAFEQFMEHRVVPPRYRIFQVAGIRPNLLSKENLRLLDDLLERLEQRLK